MRKRFRKVLKENDAPLPESSHDDPEVVRTLVQLAHLSHPESGLWKSSVTTVTAQKFHKSQKKDLRERIGKRTQE